MIKVRALSGWIFYFFRRGLRVYVYSAEGITISRFAARLVVLWTAHGFSSLWKCAVFREVMKIWQLSGGYERKVSPRRFYIYTRGKYRFFIRLKFARI